MFFCQTDQVSNKKDPTKNDYIRRGKPVTTATEFEEILDYASVLLDNYALGSMRNLHFIRDAKLLPYTENVMCYWIYFFNLDTFDVENCSYRNGPPSGFVEDYYIFLDWFDRKNDFFVITKWNVRETGSATASQNQAEGGCNIPDRGIKYIDSMIELNQMFPQYTYLTHSKKNTEIYGFQVPTIRARLNKKKRTK